jgi:hypothetical protein
MSLDRRQFLKVSALGVVAAVADSGCARPDSNQIQYPQLVTILGPERVRQLGARYRAMTPQESSEAALRAAISNGRGGIHLPFGNSLDDQVAQDFTNDRTVVVDGWVLSVTEARQAALFALTRA